MSRAITHEEMDIMLRESIRKNHGVARPLIASVFVVSIAACGPVNPPAEDAHDATLEATADVPPSIDAIDTVTCPTTPEWGAAGDLMFPGSDCLSCHRDSGSASRHPYTVAGTVFRRVDCPAGVEGATVHVVDRNGAAVDLVSNAAGNFFTDMALAPPFHLTVSANGHTETMNQGTSNGSCNACHTAGDGGAGWIFP